MSARPTPSARSTPSESSAQQPHDLLDDGFAPEPCDLLVIGCGNILRGDDAVGPVLVRHLYERGTPAGVRLVDGGTAGMDVAFGMRGASRVVIVDAAQTGSAPGTVYRVPAHELESLPPIDGLHTHNFRWDHALSFSTWLLGPLRPTDITVFLVEAGQLEPGAPLSDPVRLGMEQVIELLERDFYPPTSACCSTPAVSDPPEAENGGTGSNKTGYGADGKARDGADGKARDGADGAARDGADGAAVELTSAGYLHVPADLAAARFPADVALARVDGDGEDAVLVLVPLAGVGHGGLVLRQYTPRGDRTVLLSEVFGFEPVTGTFATTWDVEQGVLRVPLRPPSSARVGQVGPEGGSGGARGAGRGRAGERPVGGLPAGHLAPGGAASTAHDLPHPAASRADGVDRHEGGSAPTPATGGTR